MTEELIQKFLDNYDCGIVEIKVERSSALEEKVSRDPRIQTLFPQTEIEALRWSIK